MSKQFFNKMQNSSTQSTSNNQTNMFIQSCQDNKKNNIVILKEYKGHKISRGAKAGEWRNGYNGTHWTWKRWNECRSNK